MLSGVQWGGVYVWRREKSMVIRWARCEDQTRCEEQTSKSTATANVWWRVWLQCINRVPPMKACTHTHSLQFSLPLGGILMSNIETTFVQLFLLIQVIEHKSGSNYKEHIFYCKLCSLMCKHFVWYCQLNRKWRTTPTTLSKVTQANKVAFPESTVGELWM